jgi:organic radical activating enzyme
MSKNDFDPKIKLLRFADRVQSLAKGEFPPPIMADIDAVSGRCNLDCEWCAQRTSRQSQKPVYMSRDSMEKIGPFCREWGVRSWRIAGNSEPTLNPDIHYLFESGHKNDIDMGLITNGTLLDAVKNIHMLRWIGISLDATNAETWSKLKGSPKENFQRIINSIKRIKKDFPEVEISIKFVRWSEDVHLSRQDFSLDPADKNKAGQGKNRSNFSDAEILPQFAKELGVKYILRDALPKTMASRYRFKICRGTPLYATFGADHKFYLCCDVRSGYVLTDDYTRNNWQELREMWGSKKHKDLVASINPKNCQFCSKERLNTIIENIILDGEHSKEYQVNFI